MKTKNEKSSRALSPENPILDRQFDDDPNARQSWLDKSLGLDSETPRNQKRAIAAELFLRTRLLPRIEANQPVNEPILVEQLVDFRRSCKEGDVYFEMSQVAVRLLSRFQCHLLDDQHFSLAAPSAALQRELELFTILAALDFQAIDIAVREQLYSG